MSWQVRRGLRVFARGTSLRRRVAYSLAIVRLILVPVIFLAVYYLFAMSSIGDQIVSVDTPVATFAERISTEMLDARRAERNYFLFHDPTQLQASRLSLLNLNQILANCKELQPEERPAIESIQTQANLYQARLGEAVTRLRQPTETPVKQIRDVIQAYERDLNSILKKPRGPGQPQLAQELQRRLGSLDAEIAATLVAGDPAFRHITDDLQSSTNEILRLASEFEKRSWDRVQRDHERARGLVRRAEWVLVIVSSFTILISIAVSFVLPREVAKPLAELKAAVDHAAAGNYEIEFDVQGDSEVAQLATSVRDLIAHLRVKETSTKSSLKR